MYNGTALGVAIIRGRRGLLSGGGISKVHGVGLQGFRGFKGLAVWDMTKKPDRPTLSSEFAIR